jgi:hypothetical protein
MGGHVERMAGKGNSTEFWSCNFKKGNLGEVGRIIFKWALRKQHHNVWTAFVLLGILTGGGS